MRLTTIGTGTVAPHPTRVSAAHLVTTGPVRLLMDCGSGSVHRMAALGVDWSSLTHVALSHFHPDHVADLVMLVMAWRWGQMPPRSAPITLVGPVGTVAFIDQLAALYGDWMRAPGFPLTIHEQIVDVPLTLAPGVFLRATPVPHTASSVAYSVTDDASRLVYTGDTGFDAALAEWAAGCDVLLAECSLPEAMAIPTHLTPQQAGSLAAQARARQLVLTHFYPPVETADLLDAVQANYPGPVVLATDGWSLDF